MLFSQSVFLGPDIREQVDGFDYYGVDRGNFIEGEKYQYSRQQLASGAYWVSDSTFHTIIDATLKQLARAGFIMVVAHGHGPSTSFVQRHADEFAKYGIRLYNGWGDQDAKGLGIMVEMLKQALGD